MIGWTSQRTKTGFRRTARRVYASTLAAAGLLVAPSAAHALTIVPTFNGNLSASSIATINQAIAFYQSTFSDPITINIAFTSMTSGLGTNDSYVNFASYNQVSSALIAQRTSADDFTANYVPGAFVPVTSAAPGFNATGITVKTANMRALGFNSPGGSASTLGTEMGLDCGSGIVDGCVALNLGITNDPNAGVVGGYNLLGVVEHETDELLGLGSALESDGSIFGNEIEIEDLFRYASAGNRSFATNGCSNPPSAFFSIDGGNTNIDQFNNCNNGGDYGDWATNSPAQVQDAFGTTGGNQHLTATDPAVRALDVIGYDLNTQATPEPASLTLFATGLVGLAIGYRRKKS